MKKDLILTRDQQLLVEANISIVSSVIKGRIHMNNHARGLEYEELMQEGSVLLCHAAATYDESRSLFPTYARKVIYNGLISHCRKVMQHQTHFCSLAIGENGELLPEKDVSCTSDDFETRIATVEVLDLLSFYAQQYHGITKCGIEALSKMIQGMRITDIAYSLDVPPSHVGAWISRAAKILRTNPEFKATIY